MTTSGNCKQGEGSGERGLFDADAHPHRWEQVLTFPPSCVKVELVLHTRPREAVYCYALELSDPHTGELLAKVVEPSRRRSDVLDPAATVSLDVRAMLLALFDPDPF